jgi:hypothetical protein
VPGKDSGSKSGLSGGPLARAESLLSISSVERRVPCGIVWFELPSEGSSAYRFGSISNFWLTDMHWQFHQKSVLAESWICLVEFLNSRANPVRSSSRMTGIAIVLAFDFSAEHSEKLIHIIVGQGICFFQI